MGKYLVISLVVASFAFAAGARGVVDFDAVASEPGPELTGWDGIPGKGGDALFIFAAYNFAGSRIWGIYYWNPLEEMAPITWAYDTIEPSSNEIPGDPYHWNGGLGTALDGLGYTWEWYATCDGSGTQTIPDATTLADYSVVFFFSFDNFQGLAITSGTRSILEDYITAGGYVVLIAQDAVYTGVPTSWLDTWFACGTINEDPIGGNVTLPGWGVSGTFFDGWTGTALQDNFSPEEVCSGFWPDEISENGCIEDATYGWASYHPTYKSIFSTFDFECCVAAEVLSITEMLMDWLNVGLTPATWGSVKTEF